MSTHYISVGAALALRVGKGKTVVAVGSLAEAWCRIRTERYFTGSNSPKVTVVDLETGKTVATISYNGRAWDTEGREIRIGNRKTAAEREAEGWN